MLSIRVSLPPLLAYLPHLHLGSKELFSGGRFFSLLSYYFPSHLLIEFVEPLVHMDFCASYMFDIDGPACLLA